MHAQTSEGILGCLNGLDTVVHADVPQFDLAIATCTDQLTLTTALEMDVSDPLLVLLPHFHHFALLLHALIVDAHCTVAEASGKHLTFDLVRSKRGNA